MVEKFSFTSVPDEERYFTANEISILLDISPSYVLHLCRKENINFELRLNRNGRKAAIFPFTSMKRIVAVCKQTRDRKYKLELSKKKSVNETSGKSLAELKKEHPLVKDERFFTLNYFPEIVPKCFED